MTAEIVAMNKMGIALATDSTVTVDFGEFSKSFSTSKLFMLSKYHPVGIMIFGKASILTVPWEIIIKQYRKSVLGIEKFETLEEYGQHFIDYLEGNTNYFTQELQEQNIKQTIQSKFNTLSDRINDKVFKFLNDADRSIRNQRKEFSRIANHEVIEEMKQLETLNDIEGLNFEKESFLTNYDTFLLDAIWDLNDYTVDGADIDEENYQVLREVAYLTIVKNTFKAGNDSSGIVIAGYGENEYYPSLIAYDIESVVNNKLKYSVIHNNKISNQNNAFVEPYAQDDAVRAFFREASPAYEKRILSFVKETLEKFPEQIAKKLSLPPHKRRNLINELKKESQTTWEDFINTKNKLNENWVNITISMLPISELALVAEALVNLTSLKTRVSLSMETVGGSVDVATISKGEGFIWVARKNHIDHEKNRHYWSNYYRGDKNEKETAQGEKGN